MKVYLNNNVYHLRTGTQVTRVPLVEFPQNIRLDGQQQRKDRSLLSSWAIDRWSGGLGIQRMNPDIPAQLYRLWDVENCDTRNPSSIVLSPAFNTCTIVPSLGNVKLPLEHLDQIYFCHTTGTTGGGITHQFSPPFTLGSYKDLHTGGDGSLTSIKAIGHNIIHSEDNSGDQYLRHTPSLGAGNPNNIGTIVTDVTILPQLAFLGGTLHCMTYKNNFAHFYILDANFQASLAFVGSISTVIGSYLAPLVGDGVNMYAQLPEGVYDFDTLPHIAVDTSRAKDKNCSQVMFQNNLYFKNKKSLIKYDGENVVGVGYDLEDGLPAEQFGEITAQCSSWKNIFVAVKGGTYSHIYAYDGAWQYYARMPSPGLWVKEMFLSDAPDAIDRLWCVYGNHDYPGYFLNPLVNPLLAATYSFVPTGYFSKPVFGGGMSEESGAFYDKVVTADGIGGNNKITCLYGLNGDSPVTTLGVIGTLPQSLIFGSPYGLEGYRIQPKLMLHGASSGTTPIYRESVVHYLKLPRDREAFDFTVDIDQTSVEETRPKEAVIGSLNSERASRILMPFWYGQVGTKAVKVLEIPSSEDIEDDRIYEGERSGFVKLRVSEIL